ncbi:hypothetical protein ABXJ76_08285 [Methylobacter sp. G7]|uniref:hypothetical protein n=1 Tax=Methylobacter sp. G7 TaxID=3230117 RepID=UPI003D805216
MNYKKIKAGKSHNQCVICRSFYDIPELMLCRHYPDSPETPPRATRLDVLFQPTPN